MASTNKTVNYDLSQYIGTDKPTYLGDYNSDMLKIDNAIKENADEITGISGIVEGYATRINNLEETATTHGEEITENSEKINYLENNLIPIGSVIPFAGSVVPNKWLICDGTPISRELYADLYSVIGVLYGVGDGATTFNLPNLLGKIPVGFSDQDNDFNTIGKTGGEKEHHHSFMRSTTVQNSAGEGVIGRENYTAYASSLQPYITMHYIIKAQN